MNKASFLSLVRQASRISDQEVEELEKLIVNFPYCQTAHLLIAKATYDKGSMLSNQKLKKAAIYAANRQLLKKLIYTSDATVSLQPVIPAEPQTETIVPATPAAIESPTGALAGQAFVEAAVESETLSEPAEKAELEKAATSIPETLVTAETSEITTEEKAVALAQTDYEDAAIAEEILEEGYLPLSEAAFLQAGPVPGAQISTELIRAENKAEVPEPGGIQEEENSVQEEESAIAPELDRETEVDLDAPVTEVSYLEKSTEPETEAEILDQATLAEEVEIAASFEEAVLDSPGAQTSEVEITKPETEAKIAEPEFAGSKFGESETEEPATKEELVKTVGLTEEKAPEAEAAQAPVLNDDLLQETLANFDQYLFRPEKETEEPEPEEAVQVMVPENEIEAIYSNDTIGYWMNSSRLGESLEFKNDLTTRQPYDFHPELIWEYNKTHELTKEIKPAPSKLSHQLDIIDNFLKMTPRLKAMAHQKVKTEAQEDLSSKSSKINKNLASENFAHILVQQGKIKKAIKIYEHLILKIPEKKAYFVSQIEKLQNPE